MTQKRIVANLKDLIENTEEYENTVVIFGLKSKDIEKGEASSSVNEISPDIARMKEEL